MSINSQTFYNSPAGYFGALSIISIVFFSIQMKFYFDIFLLFSIAFLCMLPVELMYLKRTNRLQISKNDLTMEHKLKSSIVRFGALLFILFLQICFVYFMSNIMNIAFFIPALVFLKYILFAYIILGIPYIYMTLTYKNGINYEFNDYAILTILLLRSFWRLLSAKIGSPEIKIAKSVLSNRRISKMALTIVINSFFIILLNNFLNSQIQDFLNTTTLFMDDRYSALHQKQQIAIIYQLAFSLLFVVDVGIALIGYVTASRWLDNRTKSVDSSLTGWLVVLVCYPPINFTIGKLLGVSVADIETDLAVEFFLPLAVITLLIYTVYVWATMALGFRFSNLTNRGIVAGGPYRFIRHPAYFAKNVAWWLENPFVWNNLFALFGLVIWNIVYVLRAITEEKHLQNDKAYQEYTRQVKYRFIHGII